MDSNPRKRLLRSIRLTLTDPWELFGAVALLVAVFAIAAVLVNAQNFRPHHKKGTNEFTIVAVTTPQPPADQSPVDVSPAPEPGPPSSSPQAAPQTGLQSLPTTSARPTSHATPRRTARPTPTPTTDTRPQAALTVTVSGLSVTANASGSRGGIGNLTYRFDFGDGYVVGPGPASSSSHTYSTAYQYTVTVYVTDSTGNWSSATQTVAF
jgi:cytoskeletal protein RodZ